MEKWCGPTCSTGSRAAGPHRIKSERLARRRRRGLVAVAVGTVRRRALIRSRSALLRPRSAHALSAHVVGLRGHGFPAAAAALHIGVVPVGARAVVPRAVAATALIAGATLVALALVGAALLVAVVIVL